MAVFISHVQPLWSFAAPIATISDADRHDANGFYVRGPTVWRWVRGDDGRLQRCWAGAAAR